MSFGRAASRLALLNSLISASTCGRTAKAGSGPLPIRKPCSPFTGEDKTAACVQGALVQLDVLSKLRVSALPGLTLAAWPQ